MDAGYRYVTVNGESDVFTLPDGAEAVKVRPSTEHKRPYVYLQSLIDTAIADGVDYAILTNSDIELRDPNKHLHKYLDGVTIGNREDHDGHYIGKRYLHGFDLFILPRDFLLSLPRSMFVIGQTWWDYWLPYVAIQQGRKMRCVSEPLIWHRIHEQQHSISEWQRMTEHFTWLTGEQPGRKPHQVTGKIYHHIRAHAG